MSNLGMKRLFDLAARQAAELPDSVLLASKVNGVWQTITRKKAFQLSQDLAAGLLSLGFNNEPASIERQDKIALLSNNRPEWLITDLAVQQTGAILTPLYPTIGTDEFVYIMNEAAVKMLFIASKELYDKFSVVFDKTPTLQYVFSFDEIAGVKNWKEIRPTAEGELQRAAIVHGITEEHIATIIYTSGTTGKPKGVMLSHKNIVSNIITCKPIFSFAVANERALSFLPLNHIFEKMVTYIYVDNGISIYYAESMDTIGANLLEVRPIVFTCVPRLLEKVYERIMAKGMALKGLKRALFFWAVDLAKRYDNIQRGSPWYRMQLALANKLVFKKWRQALGNRIVAIVSGSAPLSEKLIRIFSGAQLPIMEGYGLTETSPVISVNHFESEDRRIGTVGPVIDKVEVKIADDGEILCKGDNIMVGYYKNPEQTAETIDREGWLHTGDIGVLAEGRFLKITDRKKEMFKTSGGKYVAPQAIENRMRENRFIEQVMVAGPNRKFVSALIVPNFETLINYCREHNIDHGSTNEDLVGDKRIIAFMQEQVNKQNEHLNHIEQIKKFVLLPEAWSVENGLLTPKLSLRRKLITARYEKLIDSLYE